MFIVILTQNKCILWEEKTFINKFVSTVEINPNNLIILHDHNIPKSVYK